MAASLPRKASPCTNDTERQTKNARIDDEVALVPNPTRFFKSFEDLLWFHRRGWDDVLESGEYKLHELLPRRERQAQPPSRFEGEVCCSVIIHTKW